MPELAVRQTKPIVRHTGFNVRQNRAKMLVFFVFDHYF